jgi:DNA invertase Pin-like site-specific DNA recombinase
MERHFLLQNYSPNVEEAKKNEVEPRVVTEDIAKLVRNFVRPDDEDAGASVSLVAEKANTSTRTVYRVLSESTTTIQLDLADRLCIAVSSHLATCRLAWPDGTISAYLEIE